MTSFELKLQLLFSHCSVMGNHNVKVDTCRTAYFDWRLRSVGCGPTLRDCSSSLLQKVYTTKILIYENVVVSLTLKTVVMNSEGCSHSVINVGVESTNSGSMYDIIHINLYMNNISEACNISFCQKRF